MEVVYLGLGSNLGDSRKILADAVSLIAERLGILKKQSQIFTSSALNPADNPEMEQPDYCNMAVSVNSDLTPAELLASIQKIETELGLDRNNKLHWGPRIIDIDILAIGNLEIKSETLNVPHPEIQNRDFVLMPLREIAPDFIHPVSQKSVTKMISELKNNFIKH